ncbi:MAG: glycosyltransferase [Candidatus Andersenbacteria bacterium]
MFWGLVADHLAREWLLVFFRLAPMRVAIVHDYLTQFGGAERVLLTLMELFPHAPVFTLVHDEERMPTFKGERRLRTSFLQNLPGARRHHRYFPLLMPLAVEQFDFNEYDVVLSATHSFTKGVITGPHTLHLSYCFTPTRYVWDDCHRYVREFSSSALFQRFAPLGLSYIRLWDYFASQRVDTYLTLSAYVAQRIRKYYRREALVIPPPVDTKLFTVSHKDDGYFLIVSRLVPYKRIDLAIDACEQLGVPLLIAGTGPEYEVLKRRAGRWTTFVGFVADHDLPRLYQGAKALLFPQEEDFGITPLEAAASGKPTVAYGVGGARETIRPGDTGIFFPEQRVPSLIGAIRNFAEISWEPERIRVHAESYDRSLFLRRIAETVHNQWMSYKSHYTTRV